MQENVDITNVASFQGESAQVNLQMVPNQTIKSGIIRKIQLKNFMCHSNFYVELNKNVNVFVGLNGSGKSAILTALAIGLGSKASSTSRSTNLKDLVKRGETTASIEITLANDGIDSFEGESTLWFYILKFNKCVYILEENYGKEITIVRNINGNSGASAYKLKGESGRVVSTKRQDLSKLTLCLNIQVENPVLILNQDAARSFLKECDPKKLYELFLKATQIEAIIDKLHSCLKCATSSKTQLEHLDRSVKQILIEIAEIKEKHQKLQSVAVLRQDIIGYKNELEWLKVSKVEKDLSEIQSRLDKKREQLEKINQMVKNKAKSEKALKDKICDFGTKFTELHAVVREKDEAAEAHRGNFEKDKDELSSNEQVHRNLLERLAQNDHNVNQLQAEIEERDKNPLNVDNMRKENEAKIQLLEKKTGDLNLILGNARRDYMQFTDTLNDYNEKRETYKGQCTKEQTFVQKCTDNIRQLQNSSQDTLSIYGPSMSQMISQIELLYKQKKFTEMPRGPLGRYIEVTDRKYKSAVENILDALLTSFTVCCDKDRLLLTQVLKKFPDLSRTTIITGTFLHQVHDVRNGMVRIKQAEGRVLMDVIKVSDPVVMNCLIDHRRIEQIVLVEDTDKAIELTQEVENVPQNLLRVVLLNPMSEYYPAPNYRTYAMRVKQARFIQTSHLDAIAGQAAEKKLHENKVRDITEMIREFTLKISEQVKLVQEKKNLLSELQQKGTHYTTELNDLKAIEYPEENEDECLRNELELLKKKQRQFSRKIVECEEKINGLKETVEQQEQEMKQLREAARSTRNQMTKMQAEIDTTKQQINEMNTDLKTATNQIAALQEEENKLAEDVDSLKDRVDLMVAQIESERVPTNRSEEKIEQLIRSTVKRIHNIESHNENIEDVELLLNNKIQQQEKMVKVREALDQILKTVRLQIKCASSIMIIISFILF